MKLEENFIDSKLAQQYIANLLGSKGELLKEKNIDPELAKYYIKYLIESKII